MQYVHFIGGLNAHQKTVVIHLGSSVNPEASLSTLAESSPLELRLLGLEEGGAERLEQLREQFKKARHKGSWFRATDELKAYIDGLSEVDREAGQTKRVSVDLKAEDFAILEQVVKERGLRSKAEFFREALHVYVGLQRYKDQGYLIQAIRGGKLIQFPDLKLIQ